ncbi:MAG: alpha-L-arabinofuranosidase C-terminal domain-containing protein [Bacillota bacterium]|nr:alpha-L-arabinofuranosidase C-terminal domain-containing protein [Bacillota bacterium]
MSFLRRTKQYVLPFVAVMVTSGYSQSTMTVNVDGAKTVIQKEIFGVLMERLGKQWVGGVYNTSVPNTNGMRNDVIEGFKDCGVGAAEWPGGCAADGYNWSANKRPSADVGVDRFIQFCTLTGAEAIIAGKATGNDAAGNFAFAQYILDSLKYPLKWFKVGNEVWGCGGNQSVSTYMSNYASNFAKLKDLKNDPLGKDLSIIAAAGAEEGSFGWVPTYISGMGSSIDAVEYHDYIYFPDNISSINPTTANYWTIMNNVNVGDIHKNLYNGLFPALNSADPSKRIRLDLDEWGDWLKNTGDGWMQQITLMDALSASSHLHMFIQNVDRLSVACLAQAVNVIHAIININPSGVMSKTTTYYVYKLLKPHHNNGAKLAPITASNFQTVTGGGYTIPAVNAAASVDSNGIVNISFTNIDMSAERSVTVNLTSSISSYTINSAEIVTGSAYTAYNPFGGAEQVNIKTLESSKYSISGKILTIKLPAMSVVMIRLSPEGVAVQPGKLLNNRPDAFLIKAAVHGGLQISSSVNMTTPVTISLYDIDGRTLIGSTTRTLAAGNNISVLDNNAMTKGVYLVKITGDNVNLTKQVVVAK